MKLNPASFRKAENVERRRVMSHALLAGIAAAGVALLFVLVLRIDSVVSFHNTDIRQTRALAGETHALVQRIASVQSADKAERQQEAHDLKAVAQYANKLSSNLTGDHAATVANQAAVCATLNDISTALHLAGITCTLPNP